MIVGEAVGVEVIKVVAAQLAIRRAVAEQMVGDHQDGGIVTAVGVVDGTADARSWSPPSSSTGGLRPGAESGGDRSRLLLDRGRTPRPRARSAPYGDSQAWLSVTRAHRG